MTSDYNPLPAIAAMSAKQKLAGFMGLAIIVTLLSVRLSAGDDSRNAARQAHPVMVVTVVMQDGYLRERSFTGRATAGQVSQLGFDLSGTVATITVDDGATVSKGQTLATLDTARLTAQRNQLLAKQEEAQANLAYATRTFARVKKTHDQGHASEQLLDNARNQLETVKAGVKVVAANLEANAVELEKSALKAPFDGLLTRRLVDEGTVVAAGMPLFEVIANGKIEAKVGVTQELALALKNGTPYRLINDLYQVVDGVFDNVVSVIRGQTRTQMATFTLVEGAVKDGELITLLIENEVPLRGAWLPTRALTADVRGLWRVYKVVTEDGVKKVRFENVQILHSSAERVFVTGTIHDGDQIIAGGVNRLSLGQVVTVARTDLVAHKQ